jgi:copper(I)-binding protein
MSSNPEGISVPTRVRLLSLVAALALTGAAVAGCGSSDGATSATTVAPEGVVITDPWVRATPGGSTLGAAYMTISASEGDRLVRAAVPTSIATTTEVHETVTSDSTGTDGAMGASEMEGSEDTEGDGMGGGMRQMTMREVSGIDIPADGDVVLEPGGFHIMLIDLVAPLAAGEVVPITLTFEKAGVIEVQATVRSS